jgi:anti-sigma factor RsiW
MRCAEIDNLIHAYLDGELVGDEATALEQHVAGCVGCRERVAFQTRFKADLRAKLRSRVARPEPPARLLASVRAGLDRADLRRGWRQAAPLGALLAAASVAMVFGLSSRGDSAIVEEAIDAHVKNLPVEVGGPTTTDEEISAWMQDKLPVPVRPPLRRVVLKLKHPDGVAVWPDDVALVGARLYHLQNRDAGQIRYRVGRSPVSVFVFDPSGFDFSAQKRRNVGGREVYLSEERGYSVALYRDRGVGYAVTSDLSPEELMRLVEASLSP